MDKRNLLLISNSTMRGEAYLGWCKDMIADFCRRHNVKKVLFVPYAGVSLAEGGLTKSYDAYEAKVAKVYAEFGVKLTSVHHKALPINAVYDTDCVAVGGGNTFHLVRQLQRTGLMQAIRQRAFDGMPYMGWSAGSNVAGPTLCTTNDMPIVQPASFNCLNLVPFQINPHYLDPHPEIDKMIKHGGETRQDRINEYLAVNQDMKVVGLREATALWLVDGKMYLKGGKKMVVMRYGKEAVEIEPNSDVTFLMEGHLA